MQLLLMAWLKPALGALCPLLAVVAFAVPANAAEPPPLQGSAASRPSTTHPVGWRGDGSGHYPAAEPVTQWSAQENVLWKTEVGAGHSSPIVVGQGLFLTAEPDLLIGLEVATGRERWRQAHPLSDHPTDPESKGRKHSSQYGDATPTPVSDGQHIWAVFATGVVACHDLDGACRWRHWYDARQTTTYGRTASPVLVGDRLLVHLGPLLCLDAATGKLLWQNENAKASYGTPAPARLGTVEVVITPKGQVVRVSDGKILAADLGNCQYTSPVIAGNVVYFADGALSAVRLPDQPAAPLDCKELWSAELTGDFYASPLVHGARLYTVDKAANYYVIEAQTGKTVLTKKLEWAAPRMDNASAYPSLSLTGQHLFLGHDAGATLLLQPGDQGTVIASNSLPGGSGATHVFDGRRLFLRGDRFLYCVGRP